MPQAWLVITSRNYICVRAKRGLHLVLAPHQGVHNCNHISTCMMATKCSSTSWCWALSRCFGGCMLQRSSSPTWQQAGPSWPASAQWGSAWTSTIHGDWPRERGKFCSKNLYLRSFTMSSKLALQRHLTMRVASSPCPTCSALESYWRRLWTYVQLPILFKPIVSYTSFWIKTWQQWQPWCGYSVSGVHSGSRFLAEVNQMSNTLHNLRFIHLSV